MWLLWTLLVVYAMWPLYVFVMAMMRTHSEGKTTVVAWILAFPLVVLAVCWDIALNMTVFSVIFWELPKEPTISQRLSRLVHTTGWRSWLADWLAKTLLDPYDHTGAHIKR